MTRNEAVRRAANLKQERDMLKRLAVKTAVTFFVHAATATALLLILLFAARWLDQMGPRGRLIYWSAAGMLSGAIVTALAVLGFFAVKIFRLGC